MRNMIRDSRETPKVLNKFDNYANLPLTEDFMTPEALATALKMPWTPSLVNTANRNPPAVAFRWLLWTILRCRGKSYPEIARPFRCSHTTVVHAVDRVCGSPRALVWMVRPLMEGRQHTMTLDQFWEVVRCSDEPPKSETAWSLHPCSIIRPVRLIAADGGFLIDSDGERHPRSEVFYVHSEAVIEAVARAHKILRSAGLNT